MLNLWMVGGGKRVNLIDTTGIHTKHIKVDPSMKPRIFQVFFLCALLVGCASNRSIENASANYKAKKDYKSLETLYNHLSENRSRQEADRLLGEPDISPIEGLFFYASTHSKYSIVQSQDVIYGLVVDYRNKNGMVTRKIQALWIGPMDE